MTKREEIKKFISLYLRSRFTVSEMPEDECDTEAEFILQYLHSQGVVIKIGGEWCTQHGYPIPCHKCGARYGQARIEPLIKGEE